MTKLSDLTEREILALAIASEEEDGHIYADFGQMLAEDYPDSAAIFQDMAEEENHHRRALIDLFVRRFGNHIPLVRRQDVQGFRPANPPGRCRIVGSRRSGRRQPIWSGRRRGSIVRPPGRPTMPKSASCWAIWRPRKTGTSGSAAA